jgi:hypothetical protein
MIAGFQEMHRIARTNGADFNDTVDFLEDTHRQRLDRPIMFPGFIGGHCLIPNTKLLLQSYDSDMLRFILESNEKRSEEMKNPEIQAEAEKVSARAEKLQKDLTGDKNLVLPQSQERPVQTAFNNEFFSLISSLKTNIQVSGYFLQLHPKIDNVILK